MWVKLDMEGAGGDIEDYDASCDPAINNAVITVCVHICLLVVGSVEVESVRICVFIGTGRLLLEPYVMCCVRTFQSLE